MADVTVDQNTCIACGACYSSCPGVFQAGDDGKSQVKDPNGASLDEIKAAAAGCPVGAIHVSEGESKEEEKTE
jgi:ferredoxin